MARLTDRNDWFDLWYEDKQSMIATMARNMAADWKLAIAISAPVSRNSGTKSPGIKRSLTQS